MFRSYFQGELEYLQQLCDDLGAQAPALGPMLGRDVDPGVTRLLQALAFSFGRLRERLDDDLPEVSHPLVDSLATVLLRPFPAATMMELTPSAKVKTRLVVPAGASFESRPVEGAGCTFRTTEPCTVFPWTLRRVALNESRRRLTLSIERLEPSAPDADDQLVIFLGGGVGLGLALREQLLREGTRASLRLDDSTSLPLGAVRRVQDVPLLTDDGRHPTMVAAMCALREYFAFPAKHARVTFPIGALAMRPPGEPLTFDLDLAAPLADDLARQVTTATVRLHVVPAVNLARPRPLVVRAGEAGTLVVRTPAARGPEPTIYSVDRVALLERGTLRSRVVSPWADVLAPLSEEDDPLYYMLKREPSAVTANPLLVMSFGTARAAVTDPTELGEIEIEVTTTDPERTSTVGVGDVCLPGAGTPGGLTFANVTPVSRALPATLEGDRSWHLLGTLRAPLAGLLGGDELARALAALNLPAWARSPDAKPDAEVFRPLKQLRWRRTQSARDGRVHLGVAVEAVVDLASFAGSGDVLLFAEHLRALLDASAKTRGCVDLTVRSLDSAVRVAIGDAR